MSGPERDGAAAAGETTGTDRDKAAPDVVSPAIFSTVFEQAPIAISIAREGRFLRVNAAYARLFGYADASELVGLAISTSVAPEHRAEIEERNRQRERGEPVPKAFEFQACRKDGSIFPATVTVDALPLPGGIATVAFVTDLSEVRRALDENLELVGELRDSEERFRQLAEAIPQVVWTTGPDGRADYVNGRWREVTGLTLEHAREGAWSALMHPDDRAATADRSSHAAAARAPYEVEHRIRDARTGQYRWYLARAVPLRGADGEILKWFGTATDIAERKRAEEELAAAKHRLEAILENIEDAVAVYEPGGRILFANDRAAHSLGFGCARELLDAPPELLANRVTFFDEEGRQMPPDELPYVRTERDGRSVQALVQLALRGSADRRWAILRSRAIRGPSGEVAQIVASNHDVTDLIVAQRELRAREAWMRRLFESGIIGVVRWSPGGGVVYANEAFLATIGRTREEVEAGRLDLGALTPAAFAGRDRAAFDEMLRTGRCAPYEKEYLRRDGSRVPVLVAGAMLEEGQGGVAYVLDLAERRRAEEALRRSEAQLRQSQKMEAIGQLAGGIAHDFNNLLTIINAYADLALDQLQGGPVREFLREVRDAGERAASLTAQLLAFGRKQALEPRVHDLNGIVAGMETMLRRLIGAHIELSLRLDPRLRPVRIDKGQMEQVILNLAVNARDAMPDGGTLLLETSDVRAEALPEPLADGPRAGRLAQLTVRDSGVGMRPEVRARVFEPFFTTKEVGKGTGLGLSSAYGIVAQSGGAITVESAPGRGSTFRVFIPVTEGEATLPASARSEPEPGALATIVVVEDEEAVRRLVRQVLEAQGYQVLEAASGPDALASVERHGRPVDLLLTDVVMPRMTGRELARRLCERMPDLRVLFMSGYAGEIVLDAASAPSAFLQKPFSPDELVQRVQELLRDKPPSR